MELYKLTTFQVRRRGLIATKSVSTKNRYGKVILLDEALTSLPFVLIKLDRSALLPCL